MTALEANEAVPNLEVVTERILHQEIKSKDKPPITTDSAMMSQRRFKKRPMRYNHCGRLGHIRKYCRDLIKAEKEREKEKDEKKKTHKAAPVSTHAKSSDSESSGLIANHALSIHVRYCQQGFQFR